MKTKDTRIVGKSYARRDGYDKVTGRADFTDDFSLPHMLHGRILRSPYAHAKVISIDTSAAEALPGVKAVATFKNVEKRIFNTSVALVVTVPPEVPISDQYIFTDHPKYIGDEIAAVAATTIEIAREACELIKVEYEILPMLLDTIEASKAEAFDIHPPTSGRKNSPGEAAVLKMGDIEKGWKECDVIVETKIKVPIQKQAQLEVHSAVADYRHNDKLTVWSTTQTPHPSKQLLSRALGIQESGIRVKNPPYVGGGFGVRIGLSAKAEPIAAVLSKLSRRPVKVIYDRDEDFIASDTRHSGYLTVKLGAKKDGTFKALDLRSILNTGAYCSFGVQVPGVLGAVSCTTYSIPNIFYEGYSVYTNTVPAGAMRGFGSPQGAAAVEAAVDKMAQELGISPIKLRRKNIMKVNDPWLLPYACLSSAMDKCIDRAKDGIEWDAKRGKTNDQSGVLRRGVGIGIGTHVSNSAPFCVDFDAVYLRVESDGSIHFASGAPEKGSGTLTSLPQMVAEAVGVTYESVHFAFGDTESSPYEIGAHASRSAYAVGIAIIDGAKKLRKEIFNYVVKVWGADPDKLDMSDGIITGLDKSISLNEVATHAHYRSHAFLATGLTVPPNAPPWHAHAAEVEVDIETGMVRVVKLVAAHDIGVAINPQIVEGQIEGGALMGIGYTLGEEMVIDEKGKVFNDQFGRYMVPVFGDLPEIKAIIVESNDPTGPFGAKGVGECGMIPTAAAILSALEDAIGVRLEEFPLKPERVLAAIQKVGLKVK